MIRSMTGYGREQQVIDGMDILVEIRSVNHRYYEYSSKIARAYGFLDSKIKAYIQKRVSRGKIDVNLWINTMDSPGGGVAVNHALARSYMDALGEVSDTFGLSGEISALRLMQLPDVITVIRPPEDEETVWHAVEAVLSGAVDKFVLMREREGAALREDILARRSAILARVSEVEELSPLTVKAHMEKVTARMRELLEGAAVDDARLLTEAALYADKIAVDEETVRLRSHLDQLEHMLSDAAPVGRKLDFLVQEINREANTIGSKSQDVQLARIVVDIKAEIEKIREQIQNIE